MPVKKASMTLKECYRILGVEQKASLDDIKHAYRRRALELHPDLNPQLHDAGRQFQLLNEAYSILTRLHSTKAASPAAGTHTKASSKNTKNTDDNEFKPWHAWGFSFGNKQQTSKQPSATQTKTTETSTKTDASTAKNEYTQFADSKTTQTQPDQSVTPPPSSADPSSTSEPQAPPQRPATPKATTQPHNTNTTRTATTDSTSTSQHESTTKNAASAAETYRATQKRMTSKKEAIHADRPDIHTRAATEPKQKPIYDGKRPDKPQSQFQAPHKNSEKSYTEQPKDTPYVKQIFENLTGGMRNKGKTVDNTSAQDPHSTQKEQHSTSSTAQTTTAKAETAVSEPQKHHWIGSGLESLGAELSKGVGSVKDWVRSQIDEEQTLYLPAKGLRPGRRVRVQIRRGFSDTLLTLEVVLPQDFAIGKPFRLRGMGKHIGQLHGDLYLTILDK